MVTKDDNLPLKVWSVFGRLGHCGPCHFVLDCATCLIKFIGCLFFSHSLTSFFVEDGHSCRTCSFVKEAETIEISTQQTTLVFILLLLIC